MSSIVGARDNHLPCMCASSQPSSSVLDDSYSNSQSRGPHFDSALLKKLIAAVS